VTSLTIRGRFNYSWRGVPIEVEWNLKPQHFANLETFEKIGDELRRIAHYLKKKEERDIKFRQNLHLQDYALLYLRTLFEESK